MGLEHEEVTIARECARKMNNSGRLLRWVLLIFGCGSSTLAPIGFMLMLLSDPNLPSFIGSVIPDWQDDGNGQIEASILRLVHLVLVLFQTEYYFCLCSNWILEISYIFIASVFDVLITLKSLIG